MKRILLMSAAAAAMIFASCSKEGGDGTNPTAENFSVNLSFKNAEAVTSRADGAAAVGGTPISIEDGYLCFVNASGTITSVYTISDQPTDGNNIDRAVPSVNLSNVPGSSTVAHLITNVGAALTAPAAGGSMAAYLNNTVAVTAQSDYTKVTCVTQASLTPVSEGVKAAALTLATNVSRIQLKDLKFEGMIGNVAGIFINGFYTAMELDGGAATLVESLDKTKYVAGSDIFTTPLQSFVYDTFTGKAIATTVTPANGSWGYNLFASATPMIIIKLTGVEVGAITYADPQFVTVHGFKDGATDVTTLAGGMIYTIGAGALTIKPEHLNPEPGVESITVNVTVYQAEWEEKTVTPNL